MLVDFERKKVPGILCLKQGTKHLTAQKQLWLAMQNLIRQPSYLIG